MGQTLINKDISDYCTYIQCIGYKDFYDGPNKLYKGKSNLSRC